MIDLLGALALGLGLGVITGMPLGVINVAIVDAVIAHERRHARGLALGGALADAAHTLLAFAGIGRFVTARPEYTRLLAIAAAIVIVAFAVASWRRRRVTKDREQRADTSLARGIASGIAMTLPNPAALAAWVAVAAMTWPAASLAVAIAMALGVGIGSAVWFSVLGWLVAKVPPHHRALRLVPQIALAVLVVIALVGVTRAVIPMT